MGERALQIFAEPLSGRQAVGTIIGKRGKNASLRQGAVDLAQNATLQSLVEDRPRKSGEDGIRTGNFFIRQMIAQARCATLDNSGLREFTRNLLGQDRAFFDGREMGSRRQVGKDVAGKRPASRAQLDDARCRVEIRCTHHFLR